MISRIKICSQNHGTRNSLLTSPHNFITLAFGNRTIRDRTKKERMNFMILPSSLSSCRSIGFVSTRRNKSHENVN